MEIYYWKLQTPDKLIFKMIRIGNLLLETQDNSYIRAIWWTFFRISDIYSLFFSLNSCKDFQNHWKFWTQERHGNKNKSKIFFKSCKLLNIKYFFGYFEDFSSRILS